MRDTGFLLARLEELWKRVPRYKPLSVGVVLLDRVLADHHQSGLFDTDSCPRQKLSPLIYRMNALTTVTAAALSASACFGAMCAPSSVCDLSPDAGDMGF